MKLLSRTILLVGIPAICASAGLASCEDDPILAPQTGSKPANGSYGNIAVAPPVDTTRTYSLDAPTRATANPEVY